MRLQSRPGGRLSCPPHELLNKRSTKRTAKPTNFCNHMPVGFVSAYNSYYAMDYSDLLRIHPVSDQIRLHQAKRQNTPISTRKEPRKIESCSRSTWRPMTPEIDHTDPDKANTFNSKLPISNMGSIPTIAETAAETAMENCQRRMVMSYTSRSTLWPWRGRSTRRRSTTWFRHWPRTVLR